MAILGIDEVGRGPLAGPLVVGAVILPEERLEWIDELKDSKKLSAKKREKLNELIIRDALATGLGWVFPKEIDLVGIAEALRLATRRAVKSVQRLHAPFSQIIIDGKVNFLAGTAIERYVSTMPKADDLIKEVSAASIIAKVARDNYMVCLAEDYPEYGFEKHVGYGTAKHLAVIRELGICPEHRKSFEPIRTMVGFSRDNKALKNTTRIGNRAEDKVSDYLEKYNHEIVARNFRTRFCEIDIVSVLDDKIYFTEVKYRKNDECGNGFEVITSEKRRKMEFAAGCFLKYRRRFQDFTPKLAVASVTGDNFEIEDWFSLEF